MNDDLDFDMEIVEDDELDEMGADSESSLGNRPHSEAERGMSTSSNRGDKNVEKDGTAGPSHAASNEKEVGDESSSSSARKTVYGYPPEDWSVKRLGEVARVVSGSSLPKDLQDGSKKGSPVYKVSDMNERGNEKYLVNASNHLDSKELEETGHTLHPSGSTVLPKVGAALLTNKRRMLTNPASFDNNIMGWVPDGINSEFLYYVSSVTDMEAVAQMGAVPSISKSIAEKLKIPAPPPSEQRNIASVLYTVDQAIQKTEAIIEQAKRVKRGLMQDLFRSGLDRGRNFRETRIGKIPTDWKVINAGEHLELISGAHVKADHVGDDQSFQPYITGPEDFDLRSIKVTKYTDKPSKFCERGDVLVTVKGSGCGKTAIADQRVCISRQLKALRADSSLDRDFLFYYLRLKQNLLKTLSEGSAIPGLSNSHLLKLDVPLPPKKEQNKIGSRLSSVDDLIEKNLEYRSHLKKLKRGLMQDLLTGKIRTADKAIEVLDEVADHG